MELRQIAHEEVRMVCETIMHSSSSSLTLLRAIETTCDALVWLRNTAESSRAFIERRVPLIRECERRKALDRDGVTAAAIEEAETAVGRLHGVLVKKYGAIPPDSGLGEDGRELLSSSYREAIGAMADLHNALVDLRWAIGEHDADLEEASGKVFTDVDEFIADLKA